MRFDHGKWLLEERKKRGVSRAELSRWSGVAESTIENWETGGHEPTIARFQQVITELGYRLNLLYLGRGK